MRMKKLWGNTALLSGATLLMTFVGLLFQSWLVRRIGTAGIGLYQLLGSVTALSATLAISGIRFASTRLVAEELGAKDAPGVSSAMLRCLCYAVLTGTAAGVLLGVFARPIGAGWIGDARTVASLRLTALSMPCVALSASLSGYFTACGRVWKPTAVRLLDQLSGVAFTVMLLKSAPAGDVEAACIALVLGRLGADVFSLALLLAVFLDDRRRYGPAGKGGGQTRRMLAIAVPLALSAYARSALSTAQHLLVPRGLERAGYSRDGALSGYGTVHGMALPLVFFPSCVLAAASELIVPELTERQVRKDAPAIRRSVCVFLRFSGLYSLAVSAFLFLCAEALGALFFHSGEAGRAIRLLAPLVPIAYLDMSVDGCLKGLGEQLWCMVVNVADSVVGLLLMHWLLPRYALAGYVLVLYATELFNFVLSAGRLAFRLSSSPASSRRPCGAAERCVCTAGT